MRHTTGQILAGTLEVLILSPAIVLLLGTTALVAFVLTWDDRRSLARARGRVRPVRPSSDR